MTPLMLRAPREGRKPKTDWLAAGCRTLPPASFCQPLSSTALHEIVCLTVSCDSEVEPVISASSCSSTEATASGRAEAIATWVPRRMKIDKIPSWVFSVGKLAHPCLAHHDCPEIQKPLYGRGTRPCYSVKFAIGFRRRKGFHSGNINVILDCHSQSVQRLFCCDGEIKTGWDSHSQVWGCLRGRGIQIREPCLALAQVRSNRARGTGSLNKQ